MADTKISALSAGTAAPGDEIPVNRSGSNFKITAGDILKINGGTITADSPVLNLTQTWNNAAVTFTGLKFNATDTTSASGSLLMDLQVGGTTKFKVNKDGNLVFGSSFRLFRGTSSVFYGDATRITTLANHRYSWTSNTTDAGAVDDLALFRDAAGTLAQRNAANAQTFRVYNTYTDATNTFERGKIAWESNVLRIGTEKGVVGGTARALELQTDGTTRLTIGSTGITTFDSTEFTLNVNTIRMIYAETSGQDSLTIGSNATDIDFNIKGSSNANLMLTDAGINGIGFFGATPVAQPTTGITAGTFAANTSGISNDTATFDGYTIGQVVAALRQIGLLA